MHAYCCKWKLKANVSKNAVKVLIAKLNTLYTCFRREVQFKKYLHGLSDAGTRQFRSGTHGLNEELGRHRGREGKEECVLCGDECESVSHTL